MDDSYRLNRSEAFMRFNMDNKVDCCSILRAIYRAVVNEAVANGMYKNGRSTTVLYGRWLYFRVTVS